MAISSNVDALLEAQRRAQQGGVPVRPVSDPGLAAGGASPPSLNGAPGVVPGQAPPQYPQGGGQTAPSVQVYPGQAVPPDRTTQQIQDTSQAQVQAVQGDGQLQASTQSLGPPQRQEPVQDGQDADSADEGIQIKPRRSRAKAPGEKKPPGRKTDSTTCELRGFPKSLVGMAKRNMPEAPNVRAVAAFMYAHRDPDYESDYADVPDDVIELARAFNRAEHLNQIDASVGKITKKLYDLEKEGRLVRFVLTTLIMNAHGLLGPHVTSGSDINYTPPDFDVVFDNVEKAAEKFWNQMEIRKGRPIR